MTNLEAIYQQTILPLPAEERIRLAELILERSREDARSRPSAYDYIESMPLRRVFKDSKAVDQHVRSERDSWDN